LRCFWRRKLAENPLDFHPHSLNTIERVRTGTAVGWVRGHERRVVVMAPRALPFQRARGADESSLQGSCAKAVRVSNLAFNPIRRRVGELLGWECAGRWPAPAQQAVLIPRNQQRNRIKDRRVGAADQANEQYGDKLLDTRATE
jgi:hypothetical protein